MNTSADPAGTAEPNQTSEWLRAVDRVWLASRFWLLAAVLVIAGFTICLIAIANDHQPTVSMTWQPHREEYDYILGDAPGWINGAKIVGTLSSMVGLIMLAVLGLRAYIRHH